MATIADGVYQIRNVHHSHDNVMAVNNTVILKAGDTTTWSVKFDSGAQAYFLRYKGNSDQTLTLPTNAQPGTQLTVTKFISSRGQQWLIQPSASGTHYHVKAVHDEVYMTLDLNMSHTHPVTISDVSSPDGAIRHWTFVQ